MKFAKDLKTELIFLDLRCSSKSEVLEYLARALCGCHGLSCVKDIIADVSEREKIKSTEMGRGLAVPHARTDLVDKLCVAFARLEQGVDWGSTDGRPVRYVFFITGPSRLEKEYLEALSDISRIMIRHDVIGAIDKAKNPEEIIDIIKKSGIRHGKR